MVGGGGAAVPGTTPPSLPEGPGEVPGLEQLDEVVGGLEAVEALVDVLRRPLQPELLDVRRQPLPSPPPPTSPTPPSGWKPERPPIWSPQPFPLW